MPISAPAHIKFCPRCATPMLTRVVGDKPRRTCPDCGFIYFTDPKVGVGVFVVQDGEILLIKRSMEPEIGKWSVPAGFLDYGEDPQETAIRETWEETNLEVEIVEVIDVYFNVESNLSGGASIFIMYRAQLIGGQLKAGDDAAAAAFFALDNLPDLAFASTRDAIRILCHSLS